MVFMFEVQWELERVICCKFWQRSIIWTSELQSYINDCKAWRTDRYGYLLKELVMTFYNDSIDGKSIVEWCKDVFGSELEEKMMMEALINYIRAKKFHWIVM